MLLTDCSRILRFDFEVVLSVKCLVFPEIGDCALIWLKAHVKRALQ